MTETRACYTLTAAEANELPGRILAALVQCRAENRRITGRELARRFGYRDDRKVRLAIGKLIDKGYIILASVHPPWGYFLSESSGEVRDYCATQASRIRGDAERVRQIKRNAERTFGIALPLVFDD